MSTQIKKTWAWTCEDRKIMEQQVKIIYVAPIEKTLRNVCLWTDHFCQWWTPQRSHFLNPRGAELNLNNFPLEWPFQPQREAFGVLFILYPLHLLDCRNGPQSVPSKPLLCQKNPYCWIICCPLQKHLQISFYIPSQRANPSFDLFEDQPKKRWVYHLWRIPKVGEVLSGCWDQSRRGILPCWGWWLNFNRIIFGWGKSHWCPARPFYKQKTHKDTVPFFRLQPFTKSSPKSLWFTGAFWHEPQPFVWLNGNKASFEHSSERKIILNSLRDQKRV